MIHFLENESKFLITGLLLRLGAWQELEISLGIGFKISRLGLLLRDKLKQQERKRCGVNIYNITGDKLLLNLGAKFQR